jgi:alpha-amylase/alpha-mannosidase (GH57 family)
LLVDEGVTFTVLSPYQVAAAESDSGQLVDVRDGSVNPRVPYLVEPVAGKQLSVFFYDGPLSQQIAFGDLLKDGRRLAQSLADSISSTDGTALAHVATDGETYGHHHRFGEMALASALDSLRKSTEVDLVNYASFLAVSPPTRRARIVEDSSWSCAHGIERWRSDCCCSTGGGKGWNQAWRGPLRAALDWLRDLAIADFSATRGRILQDPWAARDAYIEILLGRSEADFIEEYGVPGLDEAGRQKGLDLLEIQHRAMLMYTSCGWFFNDISGLESIFVLRQAGRAIELIREVTGGDLEPEFLSRLATAESNQPGLTGQSIYLDAVAGYMKPWPKS